MEPTIDLHILSKAEALPSLKQEKVLRIVQAIYEMELLLLFVELS